MRSIRPNHSTQEESTVSNIHTACEQMQDGWLLKHNGGLRVPWGLIHPFATDKLTFQGIDYTRGNNPELKYSQAVSLPTFACQQEFGQSWDDQHIFPCLAVFTAGPNVSATGRSNHSSMTRTKDPFASDKSYFERGVKAAV